MKKKTIIWCIIATLILLTAYFAHIAIPLKNSLKLSNLKLGNESLINNVFVTGDISNKSGYDISSVKIKVTLKSKDGQFLNNAETLILPPLTRAGYDFYYSNKATSEELYKQTIASTFRERFDITNGVQGTDWSIEIIDVTYRDKLITLLYRLVN